MLSSVSNLSEVSTVFYSEGWIGDMTGKISFEPSNTGPVRELIS
jgi:hypothetical protein